MIKKIFFGGVALLLSGIFGLMLYAMSQMEMGHLILCSANETGTRIPSSLCEYYMLNHRMSKDDIKELSDGAGLELILNLQSPEKYEMAKTFISKGLDVDGINHYSDRDITPLLASVLYNDIERVKFLIDQGANIEIRSKGYGMTALELARKLHKEQGREDRTEMINILSAVSSQ